MLQEKISALKREHPALQKMKFINFFYFFGHFCPPGSGSKDPIEFGFGYTTLIEGKACTQQG
jgi:hypothetical protein